ncbi:PKD domain-containing protein [Candidatus Kaiserbacteria bacterium]|nr:PKD domain-containing protein [Candidatus Kaiserbacteria bacterium]
MKTLATRNFIAVFIALSVLAAGASLFSHPVKAAGGNLSGYAWSSTIGWVSFSSTSYSVQVADNGTLSGYAWSPNVGWISFNSSDLSGCPSGSCPASFDKETGVVTGWARALAGTGVQTGSWGGWIHLAGSGYGVSASGCNWSGYAWGGGPDANTGVIGWLHFSGSGYGVVGTKAACTNGKPPPVALAATCSASPTSAFINDTITWTASPSGGTSPYTYVWTGDGSLFGTGVSIQKSYTSTGTKNASVTVTDSAIPTHASVTASCSPSVTITPCYGDGCGPPGKPPGTCTEPNGCVCDNAALGCYPNLATPTASLQASPTTIDSGQSSTLTWSSTNATSCTSAGGFSTSGAANNSTGVSTGALTTTSTYQITCTGAGGTSAPAQATVTVIVPTANISATPPHVPATGGPSQIAWTASNVKSCTTSGPGVNVTDAGPTVSDSRTPTITKQSTYTVTCITNGSPITKSVVVNLLPGFQEF